MFKFIFDDESYHNELTFGLDDECFTHQRVAEFFNQFLRGCGYVYDGEYVRIGKEEERVLHRFEREKARDEFIASAFDNDAGTFPVI